MFYSIKLNVFILTMNSLNPLNGTTMYSGSTAQGDFYFNDSLKLIVDHTKMIASDAVDCIQEKTTDAAQKNFSNTVANSATPTDYLVPVIPHVGCVKFNSYNINFSPTTQLVNDVSHVNQQLHPNGSSKNKKIIDKIGIVAKGVIGVIVAVMGGYAFFRAREEYQRIRGSVQEKTIIRANIQSLDKMQLDFKSSSKNQCNVPNLEVIRHILEIEKEIFSRIQRDSVVKLAIMVGVVTAVGIAISGALAASHALVITALAVGAVVGGGALMYRGFNNITKENARDGQDILNILVLINRLENQDKMVLKIMNLVDLFTKR